VHGHEGGARGGGHRGQRGRHVVDHAGPGGHRRLGDLGLAGVDRHLCTPGHQGLDDRDDPAQLLVDRHGLGARAGGLAADVDPVGALVDQPAAVRDGGVGVEEPATVRERVGCHVEDTHDSTRTKRHGQPS
jgi:hypothetical protein